MGFSRQEYWSVLPFPSPGDLPDPGIEPSSPTLQADALTSAPPGKPLQRIARREKKAFLSDQCQEIEEKNRMGKTRDLFKKIRVMKGIFYAKIGSIKDRNGRDLTGAEDIKKRWQKYTEELYKKDLHDPVNHDGVITHLEPDILECEVNWVFGSITTNKASGGDGIPGFES